MFEASNGESALERASIDHPNIMLLDKWMPGMDGFEVLRRLKRNPDTQDLPVVLLTAMLVSEGEQEGMDLGVYHFISKPWGLGVVEAALSAALSEAGIPAITPNDDDIPTVDLGVSGNVALGVKSVDLKVKDAQIFTMQSGMARLRRFRKKRINDEEETR